MKIIVVVFLIFSKSSADFDEFSEAKSPIESQFSLGVIQSNFPGLYDNVFAGVESRIAGGQMADKGQFPYQVLIYMKDGKGSLFICGGGLLTYNFILTAAHCIYKFTSITVHIGTINRLQIHSVWSGNITNKNDLLIHPRYNPNNHLNDIALIRLTEVRPSILSHPDVSVVLLPNSEEIKVNLVGMDGTVAGFGSHSDTSKASEFLRFVTMPIISNLQCKRIFGNFITPSHLCLSGSGGKSVCSGDSGGPLTVEISPNRRVVVGIVSFGHKHGCTLGHPGVFTRVTSYLSWIESNIGTIPREIFIENEEEENADNYDGNGVSGLKSNQIVIFLVLISAIKLIS